MISSMHSFFPILHCHKMKLVLLWLNASLNIGEHFGYLPIIFVGQVHFSTNFLLCQSFKQKDLAVLISISSCPLDVN